MAARRSQLGSQDPPIDHSEGKEQPIDQELRRN
jgi:hypothetical protein